MPEPAAAAGVRRAPIAAGTGPALAREGRLEGRLAAAEHLAHPSAARRSTAGPHAPEVPAMPFAKVSARGRITLPAAMRRESGVAPGSVVEIVTREDEIVIRPVLSISQLSGVFRDRIPPGRPSAGRRNAGSWRRLWRGR